MVRILRISGVPSAQNPIAHQWSKMSAIKTKKKVYCNFCRKKLSSTNNGVFCEGEVGGGCSVKVRWEEGVCEGEVGGGCSVKVRWEEVSVKVRWEEGVL